MFQNISGQASVNEEYEDNELRDTKLKIFLKNAFTKHNIIIYIISFAVSTIECGARNSPIWDSNVCSSFK